MNIYNNPKLKYCLTTEEYEKIEQTWDFINLFAFDMLTLNSYRNKIINHVKTNYEPNIFYFLEQIAEKLYWNLIYQLAYYYPVNATNIQELNMDEINEILMKEHYYRSFINKIVNLDKKNNKIYYKRLEGSCKLFDKNNMNRTIQKIFFDRNLYEKIMNDPLILNTIETEQREFYYQMDYAFPNLNICKPFLYDQDQRIERINKMYYVPDCQKNWFEIML